ncbi:hypothetical protein LTR53_009061 [Teratosphaeriaceae sp. CCFEE 6253]|nr:hypothetical protein LTR53_009061 [Teratosphaeriaceae sp. CCFEE 6253]
MSWNLVPQWLSSGKSGLEVAGMTIRTTSEKNGSEGTEDDDSTPKAEPVKPPGEVPTFSLSDDNDTEPSPPPSPPRVPSFPAPNSAQRASTMAPPPKPTSLSTRKPAPSLMPPPSRAPAALRAPPSAAASLRIPSTGPLPNRGPPPNSQQRLSSNPSPLAPNSSTPNSRAKVQLTPGHSPMDWAALINSPSSSLSGVSTFQRVTPSELKRMTGRKGKPAWSSWQGKVYNITPYLPFHPGGEAELMKAAGRDGASLFTEVHPWVNWESMLGACLVGVLVPEDHATSALEDMD